MTSVRRLERGGCQARASRADRKGAGRMSVDDDRVLSPLKMPEAATAARQAGNGTRQWT